MLKRTDHWECAQGSASQETKFARPSIGGFRYTPHQGNGGGRIKDYLILIGDRLRPRKAVN